MSHFPKRRSTTQRPILDTEVACGALDVLGGGEGFQPLSWLGEDMFVLVLLFHSQIEYLVSYFMNSCYIANYRVQKESKNLCNLGNNVICLNSESLTVYPPLLTSVVTMSKL